MPETRASARFGLLSAQAAMTARRRGDLRYLQCIEQGGDELRGEYRVGRLVSEAAAFHDIAGPGLHGLDHDVVERSGDYANDLNSFSPHCS